MATTPPDTGRSARNDLLAADGSDDWPAQVDAVLARHRAEVLNEGADALKGIAAAAEKRVADHYGAASGIGPGSADMVREAARTLRSMATVPVPPSGS